MMNLQGQGIIRLLQFSGALSGDNRNVSDFIRVTLGSAPHEWWLETWPRLLGIPCQGLLHPQGGPEVHFVEG